MYQKRSFVTFEIFKNPSLLPLLSPGQNGFHAISVKLNPSIYRYNRQIALKSRIRDFILVNTYPFHEKKQAP